MIHWISSHRILWLFLCIVTARTTTFIKVIALQSNSKKPSKGKVSRRQILDAAAKCIAVKGYDATTMRDIASTAKFLPGSIYYHFDSKEELFLALNKEASKQIIDRVLLSLEGSKDPWERLKRACTAYLECLAEGNDYALVALTEFPKKRSTKMAKILVDQREELEKIFRKLVDNLPLKSDVSRKYWRLSLLGTLAWSMIWYKDDGDDVGHIATTFIDLLAEKTSS